MRIALVNESFDARRGGAERCAVALEAALLARGHEVRRIERDGARGRVVSAIALAREAARAREGAGELVVSLCKAPGDVLFPQEGVHVASVAAALGRHAAPVRAAAAVGKLLSPKHWAFVAAEGAPPARLAGPRDRASGAGERLERMLRVVPGRLLPGSRERPAARRYIALSRRIRDDMVRLWGAPLEAIAVCPNGVDVARFAPPGAERRAAARAEVGARDGDLVVGFVSNHFALRGLEPLVRALALEGGPSLLLVGGRGRARGPARLARSLDVRARFLGELADVRPLLEAADVFALPTFYDACSLATLEALAVGLPVVTSRANGAAELFSGREGAVLERAGDMGAIAGALRRLRDPARRAACGAAARETALANPLERALGRVVDAVEEAAR